MGRARGSGIWYSLVSCVWGARRERCRGVGGAEARCWVLRDQTGSPGWFFGGGAALSVRAARSLCLPVFVWVGVCGVLVVGAGGVVVLRVAGRSVIGRFLLLVSVCVSLGGCVPAAGVGVLRWVRVGAARFLRTAQWTRASLWSS